MKSNRKTKATILITIAIFFVFLPRISNNLNVKNSELNYIINFNDDNVKISALSAPIYIDDNDPSFNWAVAKDAGICTGNGTYYEPYVIEDLIIDAEAKEDCIYIGYSNAYFIIRNCTLINAGPNWDNGGIKLDNCINGLLLNNTFSFNFGSQTDGIHLSYSSYINISENTFTNNYCGIYLGYSHDNFVSENDLNGNNIGMRIYSSNRNIISNNTVNRNTWAGIFIYKSHENEIVGNNAYYNRDGIPLLESNDNSIIRNILINNRENGIELIKSNSNLISENIMDNNNENGIILKEYCSSNIINANNINNAREFGILLKKTGTSNSIFGNVMDKCGIGLEGSLDQVSSHNIYSSNLVNAKPVYCYKDASGLNQFDFLNAGQIILINCWDSIIANLGIYNCSRGISLHFSHNIEILNNIVAFNSEQGIYLHNSYENNILGNGLYGNSIGIELYENSNYNKITDNTANENRYIGIRLYFYCNHNTVLFNNANDNQYRGIHMVFSNMNTISGNIVEENGIQGILLEFCDMNDVTSNFVRYNDDSGINLVYSDTNQVQDNKVYSNNIGIELYSSDINKIAYNILFGNNQCIFEQGCENNTFLSNSCSGHINSTVFEVAILFTAGFACVIVMVLIMRKRK